MGEGYMRTFQSKEETLEWFRRRGSIERVAHPSGDETYRWTGRHGWEVLVRFPEGGRIVITDGGGEHHLAPWAPG